MRIKQAMNWKLAGGFALAMAAGQASAEVLANYDFAGGSPTSIDANLDSTADNMLAVGSNLGFSGSGNAFVRSQALDGPDEAAAIAADVYFSFTVTPDAGLELNLESLTYKSIHNITNQAQPTTNNEAFMNFFVRSSVDGFASTVGSVFAQASGSETAGRTIDLSGAAFQGLDSAVTFRLYVYETPAIDTIQGARWDDVVLNGEVVPVPEPGSLALLGLGGLLIARRRRNA